MATHTVLPQPGEVARVRQRRYLVEEVTPAGPHDDCSRVRLSCMDDDAQGQRLEVLWERELDAEIVAAENWDSLTARGFDPVEQFAAYYHVLGWNCVTATNPNLFQSPFRAGIRLDEYQLEPLRKALQLPRVNLFIADDVGLGKTIEAGLILRELILRKRVEHVVVACPPSMLDQWREEMEDRFGLAFEILDRDFVQQIRQERGFGINPWTTHPRFLVSQRLLADEAYAEPLRARLGGLLPKSLLILDEAHHAAPASGQRYAIDSHFTRAIDDLAPRFEHRLFLSATPHNGHSNSFARLLQLLDRQRFWPGMKVRESQLRPVMVRRLKEDLREIQGGFPRRVIEPILIDELPADAPELRLCALLDKYRKQREQRLEGAPARDIAAAGLLICGLQKRLLSSVEAFAKTLRVHRRGLGLPPAPPFHLPRLRRGIFARGVGADAEPATLPEVELAAEEEQEIAALSAGGAPAKGEQALLNEMTELAESARGLPDARVRKLQEWLADNPDTRVIIFTEFEDTLGYVWRQLAPVVEDPDGAAGRIARFRGSTSRQERERIKKAFNQPLAENPLRVLLATDAAREGINLQAHCSNLFHFDLPWNPSRLEQRNGRIDRKLQPKPEVYCRYFRYVQRPEDTVLDALIRKTKIIRGELGSAADVLGEALENLLVYGIRRADLNALTEKIEAADLAPERAEAIRSELEVARERRDELRAQIERAQDLLAASKKSIGFGRERLEAAVNSSLCLLGASALAPVRTAGESVSFPAFAFPQLDQQRGADPTWADTLDSLRPVRDPKEKESEWRRRPLRPVVFADPGEVTEKVVQLHLEQRVVQRLLSRFTAQGFVYHDLARACLSSSADPIPRVILIGRLALYGVGAARLHEELIEVTARWTDPAIRKAPLAPYGRSAEADTLRHLEDALATGDAVSVPEARRRQLQQSAPGDVAELRPHLEARGQEAARKAEARLNERAENEAQEIVRILEGQRKAIGEREGRFESESKQLVFAGMDGRERTQLESERRGWRRRLAEIPGEIESEPERIRASYRIALTRIEPVGLVYLWPAYK